MNETKIETKIEPPNVSLNPRGIMPIIGILCVIAGLIWGIWAYEMSTETGYIEPPTAEQRAKGYLGGAYKEVHNIGLIAKQQKNLICAGVVTISGILLLGFGTLNETLSKKTSDIVGKSAGE